jgi:hypothetical protein
VCSICLSIFNKTVITNCLHRFCRECIVKNMGVNSICKNTCPLCRNHISSCRSIYQDKAMDALVGLYKDFKNRNAKIQIDSKLSNEHERFRLKNIFDITIKPHPESLRLQSVANKIPHCHPENKVHLKIATPDIITGNTIISLVNPNYYYDYFTQIIFLILYF